MKIKGVYMKNHAFTLIELLVVVLIIGILAAIAVPQYQKAVMRADLHRGINLVESLYQAQQAYALAHGDFATDIDDLDISLPLNDSCEKTQGGTWVSSYYTCDFGKIGCYDNFSIVQFQPKKPEASRSEIAYLHMLKDDNSIPSNILEKGKRYCFAQPDNETAISVCEGMGGVEIGSRGWLVFELM